MCNITYATIVDTSITNMCDGYVCSDISLKELNASDNIEILIWTSDQKTSLFTGVNDTNKKRYILKDYVDESFDKNLCVIRPETGGIHQLFIKTSIDDESYTNTFEYNNQDLNCDDFVYVDIDQDIEEHIFRRVLSYPIVRIPYDDNGIFEYVEDIDNAEFYDITVSMLLYFVGIVFFIFYIIIRFSEK